MNILLLAIGISCLLERIWKYASVRQFFDRATLNHPPNSDLTVSILQPILSGDPTLWDCLSGNLQMQTHYQTEFIWLIDDNDEIARSGCQQLIAQYPDKNVRLISLPPSPDGISPKTFKLIEGTQQARGEIIVVLDDDTILPDGGLAQCIPYLDKPDVGLAFGLPYYINFSNFWSSLVSCFVNGNSLVTYIPYSSLISPFTINGMFYAIKREILDRVGGFSGLEGAICDDYAIARRFRAHGYKLAQTPLRHGICTQVENAAHYFHLLNRWFMFPQASIMRSATFGELIVFYLVVLVPNFFGLSILCYLLFFPGIPAAIFCSIYFCFNGYMTVQFNHNYLNQATPTSKIFLISLVQIFLPFQILWSLLSPRKITWRGHVMQLTKDGGFNFLQRRSFEHD